MGSLTNAKFKHYNVVSSTPVTTDSSQLEVVTAAWTCGGVPCNFRSLFYFDLKTFSTTTKVVSAEFTLTPKTNNFTGVPGSPMYGNNNQAILSRNVKPIALNANWSNAPPWDVASYKTIPSTNTNNPFTIDVTDFVQFWIAKPDSNFGTTFKINVESHYQSMLLNSGTSNPTLQPKLEICYIKSNDTTVITNTIFNYYPNPAINELNIVWTATGSRVVKYRITNVLGQEIERNSATFINGLSKIMFKHNTPPAVYFIEFDYLTLKPKVIRIIKYEQ